MKDKQRINKKMKIVGKRQSYMRLNVYTLFLHVHICDLFMKEPHF